VNAADEAHDALGVGLAVVRGAFSQVDDRALAGVSSRVDIYVNGSARAGDCGTFAAWCSTAEARRGRVDAT
jgi:hypothetical protein